MVEKNKTQRTGPNSFRTSTSVRNHPGISKQVSTSPLGKRTSYQTRFRGPSGKVHTRSFDRLEDAVAYRRAALSGKDTGDFKDPRLDSLTVAEWVAGIRWQRHVGAQRNKTQLLYARAGRYLIAHLGTRRLVSIDEAQLADYAQHLSSTMSAGSVNCYLRVTRTIFEHARKAKLLRENPAAGLRVADSTRPEDRIERRALDPDEATRIVNACSPRYRAAILIGLAIGPRVSEILGLCRSDVDLDRCELRIERQVVRVRGSVRIEPPKTQSSTRTVPLPGWLVEVMCEHMNSFVGPEPGDWLFATRNGLPVSYRNFSRDGWGLAVKRAGIRPAVFHSTRVTAVSAMLMAGADVKSVASNVGHSQTSTTLNVYARSTPESRRTAVEIGSAYLDPDGGKVVSINPKRHEKIG
jgi:integrase